MLSYIGWADTTPASSGLLFMFQECCVTWLFLCYNLCRWPLLLQVFSVLHREGINVRMMSQGASKVNISLVVDGTEGTKAVKALHAEFFEKNPIPALAAASSNGKH